MGTFEAELNAVESFCVVDTYHKSKVVDLYKLRSARCEALPAAITLISLSHTEPPTTRIRQSIRRQPKLILDEVGHINPSLFTSSPSVDYLKNFYRFSALQVRDDFACERFVSDFDS